jgi:ubiquinone/menaquinone biosynthesis C-methylase UbiE
LTGLPSNCADTILAAQCFHWFGMDPKALDEIHRILKPKGTMGIIWNLPNRSVSWIKTFEEWLDPKFEDIKIPRPDNQIMFVPLRNHGGFANEAMDETTYKYSMELDFDGIIQRYKGNSVVSAAPDKEKERLLLAIEQEMKTNSDTKDKQIYTYEFVIKMHWFQKI